MAHKKAGGSTQLGRDSESKRLGVKAYSGRSIKAGQIIIRQRGSKYIAGRNVASGGDDTLYAKASGIVKFIRRKKKAFTGRLHRKTIVQVES